MFSYKPSQAAPRQTGRDTSGAATHVSASQSADINLAEQSFVPPVQGRAGSYTNVGVVSLLQRTGDLVFGEKLAHGIVVIFSSGVPSIHIRDTSIRDILESIKTSGSKISDCIKRYPLLHGVTPSKPGFRVMALALKRLTEQDSPARTLLKQVCDEALALDLSQSSPSTWKRDITLPLNGLDTRVSISVVPLSLLYRLGAQSIAVDIPRSEGRNRCGYKLELRPEQPQGSMALHAIKMRLRQGVAVAGMVAPIVASVGTMMVLPISDLLPRVSTDQALQRNFVEVCSYLAIAGTSVFSYIAHQYLLMKRSVSRSLTVRREGEAGK